MSKENIFLFVPNVIGYIRILLTITACFWMFTDPLKAALCFTCSHTVLDDLDGIAARKFKQATRFGGVFDIVIDRCSFMMWLMGLCVLYPQHTLPFQLFGLLDIMRMWMKVYRHPDWFRESQTMLEPLFLKRNQLWLGSGLNSDREKFAKARSEARRAVRVAKNSWFTNKADEAQKERFGGKKVWQCIRDMQCGRRGLVPLKLATIQNEDGNACDTAEAQEEQWRRHFTKILNIQSHFSRDELNKVLQRPVKHHLAEPPTIDI